MVVPLTAEVDAGANENNDDDDDDDGFGANENDDASDLLDAKGFLAPASPLKGEGPELPNVVDLPPKIDVVDAAVPKPEPKPPNADLCSCAGGTASSWETRL